MWIAWHFADIKGRGLVTSVCSSNTSSVFTPNSHLYFTHVLITSLLHVSVCYIYHVRALGWCSGWGAALLVGRSRDRFLVVSLDFSVTYSFRPYHGPGVDSAPSENEYQEHFLGVKAAGAWCWRLHRLHVPNIMEIWEPKPPGTLWATPGLLRDPCAFWRDNVFGFAVTWGV
jgi:hypothetical protein